MNKKYPYQVWFTSISIAPIFLILLVASFGWQGIDKGIFFLYLYFVFFGAVLSLPTLFIFNLAAKEFAYAAISEGLKKSFLALIAIVAMCITFYFTTGIDAFTTKDAINITVPASYAVSIVLSAFWYNLQEV